MLLWTHPRPLVACCSAVPCCAVLQALSVDSGSATPLAANMCSGTSYTAGWCDFTFGCADRFDATLKKGLSCRLHSAADFASAVPLMFRMRFAPTELPAALLAAASRPSGLREHGSGWPITFVPD
jgi:hypothetical protein